MNDNVELKDTRKKEKIGEIPIISLRQTFGKVNLQGKLRFLLAVGRTKS
jgi:hypothetical protein